MGAADLCNKAKVAETCQAGPTVTYIVARPDYCRTINEAQKKWTMPIHQWNMALQ